MTSSQRAKAVRPAQTRYLNVQERFSPCAVVHVATIRSDWRPSDWADLSARFPSCGVRRYVGQGASRRFIPLSDIAADPQKQKALFRWKSVRA